MLSMKNIFIALLIVFGFTLSSADDSSKTDKNAAVKSSENESKIVTVIKIASAIGPVTTREINNAIKRSERMKAEALVIELNTPGGQMESTWDIIREILASNVPVIIYVYPPGSRAASAGVFITYAAHIAVMAPQTNIGSAHPVGMGGANIDSTLSEKITNDAVAKIKTLAHKRGRNERWAEDAIRNSVNITEFEAVDSNVVNLVASDLEDLLTKVDGDTVDVVEGTRVLHTSGAKTEEIKIGFANGLLEVIADPNIAYILMAIGMLGLYFEFANPGAILPGVIGGISLILALFSFQALPIRLAGVLLIIMAMILFLLEVKVTSHGILGAGGVFSLFFGSLMLVNDTEFPYKGISLSVIIPTVLVFTGFFFLAAYMAVRTHKRKVATGEEGLINEIGITRTKVGPDGGQVNIHGEIWNAISDTPIEPTTKVQILEIRGMQIKVKPIDTRETNQ
jgi:membrane-bound serine protease (ClpP class)